MHLHHKVRGVLRLARGDQVVRPAASWNQLEEDDRCEEGEEHAHDRAHPHAHAAHRKGDERRLRVDRAGRRLHFQACAAADDDEDHEDDASNDSTFSSARHAVDVVRIPVVRGARASHAAGGHLLGGSRWRPGI